MKYPYLLATDILNKEEIIRLNQALRANVEPSITQEPSSGIIKTSSYNGVFLKSVRSESAKIVEFLNYANTEVFNFDLHELQDESIINYNVYTAERNSEYGWHSDFPTGSSKTDIKLTVIVNLSQSEYEGGQFELFINHPRLIEELNAPGSCFIFPSILQHRVTPVTSGERISLSMWCTGPQLR